MTGTAGFGGLNQTPLVTDPSLSGQLGPVLDRSGSEHLNSCRAVMRFKLKKLEAIIIQLNSQLYSYITFLQRTKEVQLPLACKESLMQFAKKQISKQIMSVL